MNGTIRNWWPASGGITSSTDQYRLFFHDTHHRSVSDPGAMAAYDLTHFDAVLAYGNVIRDKYLANGWARQAWTWHEAADTRRVPSAYPQPGKKATWCGSATGATTNAPEPCVSF